MKKTIVFTLTFFITLMGLKSSFAQGITVISQNVYDTGPFDGWSRGNSNGLIEPGERIELRVTVKNNGRDTANNVLGILHTTDTSVKISKDKVSYGNIPAGSYSPTYLMLFQGLQDLRRYTFKIEVQNDAIAHDVSFKFILAADNRDSLNFIITLPIVDPSNIRLRLPDDLISEEAFSSHSTYFTFKAKHPTLTGISDTAITYGDCIITLHIPKDVQTFMSPIQTQSEISKKEGIDLLSHVGITLVSEIAEEGIKEANRALTLIELFVKAAKLFRSQEHDLKVTIQNIITSGRGYPDTEIEYIVLLRHQLRSLGSIDITVEQEYSIGDSNKSFTAVGKAKWIFDNGWASPTTQSVEPVLGANYPNPFNPETWIPYQLAESANVTLTIHTINGQVVRQLALGYQPAGIYHGLSRAAYWDGRNTQGEPVASGVYFYTLKAGESTVTRKMLIKR